MLAVAALLLLKLLLDPVIPQQSPFLLLAGAVVVAAWFGGFGPGVLATVLGALAGAFFAWATRGSFVVLDEGSVPLVLFVVQGLVISSLVEVLHSARRRAEESMMEAQGHQERLRRSEERFRLLVEGVGDYAIFMLDTDGRVSTWNKGAQGLFGYTESEIVGEPASILFTPEDIQDGAPEREFGKAVEEGRAEDERWHVRKDGSRFWASGFVRPIRDEAGNLRGLAKVARDITELKETADRLRESEERYRAVVKQSTDGIYLVDGDTKRILETNPALQNMLGYTANELRGMELHEIVAHDRESVEANVERTLKEGKRFIRDRRYRRKDGSVVEVEVVASAIYYAGKRVICAAIRDITERKRAEEALRESERKYRTLVEQVPAITYIEAVDREERKTDLLYVSPQIKDMFGYSPEEWMGDPDLFEKLLHPGDRERVLAEDARTDETREPFSVEYRQFTKDGRVIWVSDEAVLVEDEEGQPLFWQGVMHDVTDQKQTEEALRQSEELYRSVVEQAAENIFLIDVETRRILEANAAFHNSLGYAPEELEEITLYDIVAHDRESIDRNIELILHEGQRYIGERKYRRKDGSLIDVEGSVSAISYRGRETMCIVAHDITERKQMEENLRNSLGVLLALREAGQVLGSTLESEEIVSRLLEIMRGVSNLTAVVISMQDREGIIHIRRSAGLQGLWHEARFAPEAAAARQVALGGGEQQLFRLRHPELESEPLVGLCLPLRSRDHIVGVLEAYGPESLAESDTVEILASLASQATSALENAQLYERLEEREQRLQELVGKLLRAQEEERRRVAYEVHDGLAQIAAGAHQHLQAFAERYAPGAEKGQRDLERILRLVRATVSDARRIIADLRPTTLDDLGLAATIAQEVERLREDGYEVDYREELGDERLPVAAEIALFRVTQEALTNMRKHAQTQRVRIELRRREDEVRLEVQDYGRGFDPNASPVESGPGERVGLAGMRERIGMLGGKLEIHSEPDVGTTVTAAVPLIQAV